MRGKTKIARTMAMLVPFALLGVGLAFDSGTGTLSAFGIGDVAAVCPLGIIETFVANGAFVPRGLVLLAAFVVVTLVFGRAFCGWVCPVPLLQRLRPGRGARDGDVASREAGIAGGRAGRGGKGGPGRRREKVDSRHWVLGGALVSSALCGFPVFCLVCPVGLTFATGVAVWRLFQYNEPNLSLVVFPLVLVLELLVLRTWCSKLCPLAALMSLVAPFNRTFRPRVDAGRCLQEQGGSCRACARACPQGIDLRGQGLDGPDYSECVRCRGCVDVCPAAAVTFPLLDKKPSAQKQDERADESGDPGVKSA